MHLCLSDVFCNGYSESEQNVKEAILKGDWNKFIELSKNWANREPSNPMPIFFVVLESRLIETTEEKKIKKQDIDLLKKNIGKAIIWSENLAEKYPHNANPLLLLGYAYASNEDKNREALRAFEKAIKIDPKNIRAHYEIAAIYYSMKDRREPEAVIRKYKKVIEMDPYGFFGRMAKDRLRELLLSFSDKKSKKGNIPIPEVFKRELSEDLIEEISRTGKK